MSSQVRNDRRDNRRLLSQSARRQEWIPRGSALDAVSQPPSANADINGDGGDSSRRSGVPEPRRRGNFPPKRQPGRSVNPRRERVRAEILEGKGHESQEGKGHENQEAKGGKDLNLPQLVQEIHEKLTKGTVECMICYDMVRRSAAIWSCSGCYSIFHLNCIKKWARAPTSVDLSAEKNQGFNWRCPGCQAVQLTSLKDIHYVCFCGKRPDPPSDLYLTPHSCGETCGKPLEKEVPGSAIAKEELCPHLCVLQCHPGPCPPCKAFAPPRLCPCGKKIITTRCSDRKSVLTCGQHCDKLLNCWRHRCDRICHTGLCDPCDVLFEAFCFCKRKVEAVHCGTLAVKGEVKVEDGVFSCSSVCGKKLSCGNHDCGEICHPGSCGECDLMPSKIKTCNCGKTALQEERESCLEPIPTCSQICGKDLPCGLHQCKDLCHQGDCAPCVVRVTQKCRCGSTFRTVECYKTTMDGEKFTCEKACGQKKNCGRHRCSERCCPLSKAGNSFSGDWDPHFCSMACGKKLRCGQHSCESLCHSGHCPPCLETIFTDLTCACGRTSMPPPLPCGTPSPSCQYPCSVPQPCGHTSSHSCHFGDCPPCSVPVAKECIGGHVVLRNIPCGSRDIKCNKMCGKTRQCGMHACSRTCHSPPCDTSSESASGVKASCGQTCGAPRRDCRHTCTAPCHPSSLCPDLRCEFPVTITCSCGRITASVPCDVGGSSVGFNSDTVLEASIAQRLPVPLQPAEANGKRIPLGQRKLMCDDECSKLERKRVLADAFGITPINLDALHFGENSAVSEVVLDLFRRDPKWVLSVEERCKCLVLGKNRGWVHVFCPMLKEKRDAITLIAERWKLSVNSAGWEPKRFIVIHVTPKSKAPARIIGAKASAPVSASLPPAFDPLVDTDPRLVVALFDLPSDSDISTLVLRFGGECELIWLNDKNALAVFSDPARAATAMRRLDRGSAYQGACVMLHSSGASAWGGAGMKGAWKKAVVQDSSWNESSWGDEEWSSSSPADLQAWKKKDSAIPVAVNRWSALDSDMPASSAASAKSEDLSKQSEAHFIVAANSSDPNPAVQPGGESNNDGLKVEVVDDWEEACE